jgi:hypothetical protein
LRSPARPFYDKVWRSHDVLLFDGDI